jgi:NADPH-dependent curcumin reductase CurA
MPAKELSNRQVILKDYFVGPVKDSNFEIRTTALRLELQEGSQDVIVKNLYLSPDPYMRNRMKGNCNSYIPPFVPGKVVFHFLYLEGYLSHFLSRCVEVF